MNPFVLKRISLVGAILTVLIAVDGLYMIATNYHPDDTSNNGFGGFHPSDGVTVLIAALLLLVVTIIAFVLSRRVQPETEAMIKSEAEPEVEG
jgi:drug/metabolite transporter (DMT)-like permease